MKNVLKYKLGNDYDIKYNKVSTTHPFLSIFNGYTVYECNVNINTDYDIPLTYIFKNQKNAFEENKALLEEEIKKCGDSNLVSEFKKIKTILENDSLNIRGFSFNLRNNKFTFILVINDDDFKEKNLKYIKRINQI